METFFIRHTSAIRIDAATRKQLYESHRIYLHYPDYPEGLGEEDNCTFDPDHHHKRGSGHVRRLVELCRSGGYVCAEYFQEEGWIVGFVEPGTVPEIIEGRWNDRDRVARLKTLKLTRVRHITEGAGAAMLSARPRQGAFMRWHKAGRSIIRLVDRLNESPTLADFSADQQEILCSEFLRLEVASASGLPRLAHLVLPTGRTMRDIDILGVATDGKQLVAQVTYSPRREVQHKLDRLLPYVATSHAILFCETDTVHLDQGIHVVPMRLAFDTLMSSPLGAGWLAIAFGV